MWKRTRRRLTGKGSKNTKLFQCWLDIRKRMRPSHKDYKHYAERGIELCFDEFEEFRDYVRRLPGLQKDSVLDRIDNEGNYEPGNLRWVTWAESNRNRSFR